MFISPYFIFIFTILLCYLFFIIASYKLETYTNNTNKTHTLNVIKLATNQTKKQGLMFHKTKLKDNQGTLFFYNSDNYHCVWMKNTYIPLDIIFLDSSYNVIHYKKNMLPFDETKYCCPILARHFIEVNSDFINKNNIKLGDKFTFNYIKKL